MLVLIPIARKTHHLFRDSNIANPPLPAHPAAMNHTHHIPTHTAIAPSTTPAASAPIPHTSRIRAPLFINIALHRRAPIPQFTQS